MGDRRDQRRKVPSFRPPQSKTDHDGENYDGEGVDALLFLLSFHLILLFTYLPLKILQALAERHPDLSPRIK